MFYSKKCDVSLPSPSPPSLWRFKLTNQNSTDALDLECQLYVQRVKKRVSRVLCEKKKNIEEDKDVLFVVASISFVFLVVEARRR